MEILYLICDCIVVLVYLVWISSKRSFCLNLVLGRFLKICENVSKKNVIVNFLVFGCF